MHVVIFEGSHWGALAPISLARPTFTLMSGMTTLLEKQVRSMRPTRLTLWVRSELEDYCRHVVAPQFQTKTMPVRVNEPLDDEPALIANGRIVHFSHFEQPTSPCVCVEEGTEFVRQAYVKSPGLSREDLFARTSRWTSLLDLPRTMAWPRFATHAWDLLNWNEESLIVDSMHWRSGMRDLHDRPDILKGPWHLVQPEEILMAEGAKLGVGCVIDASNGPVALAKGSSIGINAVVQGPCYIGAGTEISALAHIRPGTSIGPRCKIGGEVSNSIIIGHTNKPHEGFLGDSYIGEWVNLGAGTTTSNLKNTYGTTSMPLAGREIDTGRRFLGSLIGDHSKMAIGTRLMSGSYVGFCSMLAGSAIPPRYTPSFTFSTDKGTVPYRLERAFEVARAVFARRNREWTPADEALMRSVAQAAAELEAPLAS